MAVFSSPRYLFALSVLCLYLSGVVAKANLSFSFKNFGKDSKFESVIALYGDAKVVSDGLSVEISGSGVSSAGRLACRKPINLIDGRSRKMVSFSTYFSFSMSRENGDGLAFVLVPAGFPLNMFDSGSMGLLRDQKLKFLAVEYDTLMDDKYGVVNANHVGLDVESLVSVKVSNVSSMNLVLRNGEKLQSWIDYEANTKTLEVRLSKFGDPRPVDPLLSYSIDLSQMWRDENVIVGLSSSSGNSSQRVSIYSWSFRLRTPHQWMHSEPLDPENFMEKEDGREEQEEEDVKVPKTRIECTSRVLIALVFGAGCGVLAAFLVLFLWSLFGNRRPVVPEEFAAVQSKEFQYRKFHNSCSDKTIKDGAK